MLQSFLILLTNNIRVSVYLTIAINAAMNTSDTISDIGMFWKLLGRDLPSIAIMLLCIDFFPAMLVTVHHLTSSTWKILTGRQKIGSLLLLAFQPFSVLLTSFAWMCDVQSDYRHYLSRLSTLIHGHLESPLQMGFFIYMWSKGYLRTPWEETSMFVDRNGNKWSMGNVLTTISLTLTIGGMIKGCLDSFESTDKKFQFLCFSTINMVYRIGSLAFYIQYFDDYKYILPVILPLLGISSIIFLRRSERHGKRISVLSSVFCSLVVPVSATDRPHRYQIKLEEILDEEERKKEEQERKILSDEIRRNSGKLSMITSPLFLVADLGVVIASKTEFKNSSIWTNDQLLAWFSNFFLPMFFWSLLAAYSMYSSKEEEEENDESEGETSIAEKVRNIPKTLQRHVKTNWKSDVAVLATILTVILHSAILPHTHSNLIAITNSDYEIKLFEARTSFDLSAYCYKTKCNFTNLNFNNSDYRTLDLLNNHTLYVDENINVTELPKTFWLIEDGLDWELMKSEVPTSCKRCIPEDVPNSPQYQRCKTLALEGTVIKDCGKGNICRSTDKYTAKKYIYIELAVAIIII